MLGATTETRQQMVAVKTRVVLVVEGVVGRGQVHVCDIVLQTHRLL